VLLDAELVAALFAHPPHGADWWRSDLAGPARCLATDRPSEHLVAGLPDGDSYAVGTIGHARRGGKNTVPAGSGLRYLSRS
jgi:hypothetical protein